MKEKTPMKAKKEKRLTRDDAIRVSDKTCQAIFQTHRQVDEVLETLRNLIEDQEERVDNVIDIVFDLVDAGAILRPEHIETLKQQGYETKAFMKLNKRRVR